MSVWERETEADKHIRRFKVWRTIIIEYRKRNDYAKIKYRLIYIIFSSFATDILVAIVKKKACKILAVTQYFKQATRLQFPQQTTRFLLLLLLLLCFFYSFRCTHLFHSFCCATFCNFDDSLFSALWKVIFHANIDNGVKRRFSRWQVHWEQRLCRRCYWGTTSAARSLVRCLFKWNKENWAHRTVNTSPQSMRPDGTRDIYLKHRSITRVQTYLYSVCCSLYTLEATRGRTRCKKK